jgi:ribosomal protein S18 acetylase RimI-like enzyme
MTVTFREAGVEDIPAMFEVRVRTRENAFSAGELAALGITPQTTAALMHTGALRSFVCVRDSSLVGFCSGAVATGEVLVIAVLPEFERQGIGRALLRAVSEALLCAGCRRLWLSAAADPATRAHGFYRALGWRPTGDRNAAGDEILEYRTS